MKCKNCGAASGSETWPTRHGWYELRALFRASGDPADPVITDAAVLCSPPCIREYAAALQFKP